MKEVKMTFTNKDGSKITKNVPENLASLYTKQGWTVVDDKSINKEEKTSFGQSDKR